LPALILVLSANSAGLTGVLPSNPSSQAEVTTPPSIDNPSPNGGGFDLPAPDEPGGSENGDGINDENEQTNQTDGQDAQTESQITLNPAEGVLIFLYHALAEGDLQDNALDDGILDMLDMFLELPHNTQESIVAVATPYRIPEEFQPLVTMVCDALLARGAQYQMLVEDFDDTTENDRLLFAMTLSFVAREPDEESDPDVEGDLDIEEGSNFEGDDPTVENDTDAQSDTNAETDPDIEGDHNAESAPGIEREPDLENAPDAGGDPDVDSIPK